MFAFIVRREIGVGTRPTRAINTTLGRAAVQNQQQNIVRTKQRKKNRLQYPVLSNIGPFCVQSENSYLNISQQLSHRFVEVKELHGHKHAIYNVVAAHSEKSTNFFTGSDDHLIKMWNTKTMLLEHTFRGHNNCISYLNIAEDDKYLVSGSNDKTVKVWNVDTGSCEQTIDMGSNVSFVAFRPGLRREKQIFVTSTLFF